MEIGPLNQLPISRIQPAPELLELQSLMPIDRADYNRLYADIKKSMTVRDPLKCYMDGEGELYILGGYNRWTIAKELGIKTVPVQIYTGTPAEYKELIINDNLNRRHLTRDQKTALVNYFLKKDFAQSDREIAKKAKVDHKTVKGKRDEMEGRGEIPHVDKRTDTKGRQQPATKPTKGKSKVRPSDSQKITLPPAGKGAPSTVNFERLMKSNKFVKFNLELSKFFEHAYYGDYKDYGIKNQDDAKKALVEYIEKKLPDWK